MDAVCDAVSCWLGVLERVPLLVQDAVADEVTVRVVDVDGVSVRVVVSVGVPDLEGVCDILMVPVWVDEGLQAALDPRSSNPL